MKKIFFSIVIASFLTGCMGPVAAIVNGRRIPFAYLDRKFQSEMEEAILQARIKTLDPDALYEMAVFDEVRTTGKSVDSIMAPLVHSIEQIKVREEEVTNMLKKFREQQQSESDALNNEEKLKQIIKMKLLMAKRAKEKLRLMRAYIVSKKVAVYLGRKDVLTTGADLGPSMAPVTVVEFLDFHCPYCVKMHELTKKLVQEYKGQIRVVFRHPPLEGHDNAALAAEVALCAGEQQKFWPMADSLFENATMLDSPSLRSRAAKLGLDASKLEHCVSNSHNMRVISNDGSEAEALGLSGAPNLFIGLTPKAGRKMSGFYVEGLIDEETMRYYIDRELSAVRK